MKILLVGSCVYFYLLLDLERELLLKSVAGK